jgi:hypothetical protein
MRFRLRVIACAAACLGGAVPASHAQAPLSASVPLVAAQTDTDPSESARFRLGALRLTPWIAISNVGTDNNVFNESENPKRDTTAAVGPASDLWLRVGRSRLSGRVAGQYLYFNEFENQRAWNTANNLRWEVPLARLTPFVVGSLSNTKDRPGYEIDSRVRRKDRSVGGGTLLRISGKTTVAAAARRTVLEHDNTVVFNGSVLAQQLDRTTDNQELQLRVRLTPLTTFIVRGEGQQDRFTFDTRRDGNSVTVMPGFQLRPQALISGSAFVGVRRFNGATDALPDFTGVVANVDTAYTVRATQFQVRVSRDLMYSYEPRQPYFALTDAGLTVVQRITTAWDMVGRASRQTMAYRNLAGVDDLEKRVDRSWILGGGFGYHLGESLRLGLDANYYRRESQALVFRNFEGLRVGASISYGLPQ